MENQELLEFANYMSNRDKQVDQELRPYYDAVREMEERHMNSYVHVAPYQRVLLDESGTIYRLGQRIHNVSSMDELRSSIEEDMNKETTNDAQVFLQRELNFIEEYKHSKEQENGKNSFNR